jgi:drug/metabolite transporter (DMT)-like permease
VPPRLGAFLAVVLWGISFVATKAVLREISPIALIFTRFGLGALLLLAILVVRGQPIVPPRSAWPTLVLLGFVGVFLHQMLQAYGLVFTSAVNTGWLIGLIPIWSAVLSAIFLRERFGAGKLAGLAIGFAGALVLVTKGRLGTGILGLPSTRGDFLILLSTVNWAVYTILGRATLGRIGASRTTAAAMFLGWLMLGPLFAAEAGWRAWGALSAVGWGSVLFLGIGCSALGYLFWYEALARLEPSRVAAFLYLEPLVTLSAAMIFLGEKIHATTILGGALVLVGVFLVQNARFSAGRSSP